jgi:glycine/D-amino acid oxidase-like deaminating enzyme
VVLVEAVKPGAGATGRSAGIATVQMERPIDVILSKRGIEIIESWVREYGLMGSVKRTGLVSVDWADELNDLDVFDLAGVKYEVVSSREAKDRWRWLVVSEDEACLYTSLDLSVEPGVLVNQLVEKLRELGVRVLRDRLLGFKYEEHRLNPVFSSGSVITPENIVLATGSWTREILSTLGLRLDTMIIKCPIVVVRVNSSDLGGIICFSDERNMSYWRPSVKHDRTLVGGGYDAWLVKTPETALTKPPPEYPERALKLLKARVNLSVELVDYYAGPCSIPADFELIAGRVPGYNNLYIIEGLRGYGLARSPAVAERLVEMIMTGRNRLPVEYDPARIIRTKEPK